ncbi:MAG: putative lipid II flippase FtsW [bacterium]|nr:putative lipid II flippase FtsW [bacterium]
MSALPPHTATMPQRAGTWERLWWSCVLPLIGFGWLAQTIISARPMPGAPWWQLFTSAGLELGLFVFGIVVGSIGRLLSPEAWRKVAGSTLVAAVILLGWAKLQGASVNGADRWIFIFGMSFQPLEFAKLAVILSGAWAFAAVGDCTQEEQSVRVGGWLFYCGLILLLVFVQPNLSGTALLGVLMFVLAWVGGISQRILFGLLLIAVLLLGLYVGNDGERGRRWQSFSGNAAAHDLDTRAESYQADQAAFAMARGGWFGVGPGRSELRYALPQHDSDFIFAILVEEYGFLGGVCIILALGGIIAYVLWLGGAIENRVLQLVALGIAVHWGLQVLIHLQVNLGGYTTGVPLPFFSKGGSAALVVGMEVALVAMVAQAADRVIRIAQQPATTTPGSKSGRAMQPGS